MVMGWLTLVLLVLLVVVLVVGWMRAGESAPKEQAVAVAHVTEARRQPRFERRLRVFHRVVAVAMSALIGAALVGAYLSGRPKEDQPLESSLATRDIVLCLDISGSVIEFDGEVLQSFETLVDSFQGERIALVVWNAGARTIFPLTDDYEMVRRQLESAQTALEVEMFLGDPYPKNEPEYLRFASGTDVGANYGSSLVGDGLASCTFAFDLTETDRSRTVLFATDNELAGNPVYSLDEAAQLAQDKGITVHGLYIEGWVPQNGTTMQRDIEAHDGYFYNADDPEAAGQIIADVQSQDAKDLGAVDELVTTDSPGWWPAVMAVLVLIYFGLAVKFRL